jgi:NADH dehydrogenase (ubiquinone) 1 alpha subcomplex subunit 6
MNCWKQSNHVLGIMLENKEKPQRTFLQKFFEGMWSLMFSLEAIDMLIRISHSGRDEDAVVPAASGVV